MQQTSTCVFLYKSGVVGGSFSMRQCVNCIQQTWWHGCTGGFVTKGCVTLIVIHSKYWSWFTRLLWFATQMFPQVCGHVCRCYSVAAQFEECREKIIELPNIIRDLCRILYYGKVWNWSLMLLGLTLGKVKRQRISRILRIISVFCRWKHGIWKKNGHLSKMFNNFVFQGLPKTAALGVQCVSSFAVDFFLQTHLYHAGVLWHLLVYLFNYDYTLEESGVQTSQDTNQQEVSNNLAKLSLVALSRLGGYSQTPHSLDGTNPVPESNGIEGSPPENPAIRKSLAAMLTPYISRKLGTTSPAEVHCENCTHKHLGSCIIFLKVQSSHVLLYTLGFEAAELQHRKSILDLEQWHPSRAARVPGGSAGGKHQKGGHIIVKPPFNKVQMKIKCLNRAFK